MTRNRQPMNRMRPVSQQVPVQTPPAVHVQPVQSMTESILVVKEVPKQSVHDRKFAMIRDLLRNGLPENLFNPILRMQWQKTTIEVDIRDAAFLEILNYTYAAREWTGEFGVPSALAIAANPVYLPVKVFNDEFPRGQEKLEVFQHRKGTLLLERYYAKHKEYLTNMNDLIRHIHCLDDTAFEEFEQTFAREYEGKPRIKL